VQKENQMTTNNKAGQAVNINTPGYHTDGGCGWVSQTHEPAATEAGTCEQLLARLERQYAAASEVIDLPLVKGKRPIIDTWGHNCAAEGLRNKFFVESLEDGTYLHADGTWHMDNAIVHDSIKDALDLILAHADEPPTPAPAEASELPTEPHWWCERCYSEKSPVQVTYHETCTKCGGPMEWKEPPATPASEVEQPNIRTLYLRAVDCHVRLRLNLGADNDPETINWEHHDERWIEWAKKRHAELTDLRGKLAAVERERDQLRILGSKQRDEIENLRGMADAVEWLRAIGRVTGCDHVDDPDGRRQLVNCVEQVFVAIEERCEAEKQARETAEQENVKLLERVAELGALESVEELFVGQYWDGNEWISPCCQGGSVKEAEAACERFGASMNAHTRIVRHSQQVVVKHGPPAALNTANAGEAGE
jgi:hypothetical protein